MTEPKCEACGTIDHTGTIEYVRVRTTNGGLLLCRLCLDDINRKNPELLAMKAVAPSSPDLRKLLEECKGYVNVAASCEYGDDNRHAKLLAKIDAALAAPALAPAWTTAAPTVPAWYWWKRERLNTRIVQVANWPGGGLAVRIPEMALHSDGILAPEDAGGEWYGPLPLPPGPTEATS